MHKSPNQRLRLLNAGAWEAGKGVDFPFHQHPAWELVYYREGHIEFLVGEGEVVPVGPGTLVLAPPRIPHAERALTAYANFHLLVAPPAGVRWPRVCLDDARQSLHQLCGQIVDEYRGAHAQRAEMLDLLLGQLSIALNRAIAASRKPSPERLVSKAEILMAKHFASSIRISEIARQCQASPASLRAHFSRLRGCSPAAWLQKVRLQQALVLINTSDLTLEYIAELCGYDSASHLSRHVKRATGKSPGALRRS